MFVVLLAVALHLVAGGACCGAVYILRDSERCSNGESRVDFVGRVFTFNIIFLALLSVLVFDLA